MCGPRALGVQLVFVPEAYGGMDGGAFDSYRVCEVMARHDIGLATAVFATFLGSDPILVGGTEEQKQDWLGAIAEQGIVFAYGATEPEAGSDLGAMTTVAEPSSTTTATSRLPHQRPQAVDHQRLASPTVTPSWPRTPGGPSWFVVAQGHRRASARRHPEDKHGIRLSNTAALFLDDVEVPGRQPDRRGRGQGPGAGAAGLRLHPPDGGRVRSGRRLGGARPGHRLLDRSAMQGGGAARARSRATPTS